MKKIFVLMVALAAFSVAHGSYESHMVSSCEKSYGKGTQKYHDCVNCHNIHYGSRGGHVAACMTEKAENRTAIKTCKS